MKIQSLASPFLALAAAIGLCGCTEKEKPAAASPAAPGEPLPLEYPGDPVVEIKTSEGTIRAELFKEKAPKTVENFLKYVEKKHFDNTIFHRVMKGFMIQGGGFENQNGNFIQKATDDPIVNEAGNRLKNNRGTLAMARTNDPHSATDQFFINTVNNNKLNLGDPEAVSPDGYAVFGKVLSGMAVVDKIENTPTSSQMLKGRLPNGELQDQPGEAVPVKKIVIESITLVP